MLPHTGVNGHEETAHPAESGDGFTNQVTPADFPDPVFPTEVLSLGCDRIYQGFQSITTGEK
jgi:hypothetical protein